MKAREESRQAASGGARQDVSGDKPPALTTAAHPARRAGAILNSGVERFRKLHRDERGTISILTVATVIGLMMLLGMVINVGRHIDDKVKMQNAADAAAYSGGTVLARGMNSIAFTNHLLCDVFALTAFMREASNHQPPNYNYTGGNALAMVPDILAAWKTIGPIFGTAEFTKFQRLGPAITNKVPLEQEAVRSYGAMSAAISDLVLPVLEYVLREQLIPEFQRTIVRQLPLLAQQTTNEISRRYSLKQPNRAGLGMLWRTSVQPVGYPDENNPVSRTLPAVDPTMGSSGQQQAPIPDPHPDGLAGADYSSVPNGPLYVDIAVAERDRYSKIYLEQWIADRLRFFATDVKMSQYINLFRLFAGTFGSPRAPCGQLGKLLYEEYPTSNLPHIIRLTADGLTPDALRNSGNQQAINSYLDQNMMFLGVVYRRKFTESFNGLFKNPLASDPQAFAQVQLFIPQPRLWLPQTGGAAGTASTSDGFGGGGGFGVDVNVPAPVYPAAGPPPGSGKYWVPDRGWSVRWNLFNQNWTVQLVPAYSDSLASILQAHPPQGTGSSSSPSFSPVVPNLGNASPQQIRRINGH